jgi:hypothetical protein
MKLWFPDHGSKVEFAAKPTLEIVVGTQHPIVVFRKNGNPIGVMVTLFMFQIFANAQRFKSRGRNMQNFWNLLIVCYRDRK